VLRLKRKPWQHGHVRSSPHTSLGWSSWLKPITSHWYRYWGQSNLTTFPQESYGSGYAWQDSTTISTMYQESFLHCWYTFTCTLIIRQQWHKTPGWSRDDNGTLCHMSPTSTQTLSDYLKTQEEDKMCTSVSIYCQKGWPERKNKIATELRPYRNARSELTVDKNSLLLYQKGIVVPKSLQRNTWDDPLRAPGSTNVQTMSKHSSMVAWTFTWSGKHGSTVPHLCTECYPSATAHDPNKATYQTLHGKRLVQTFWMSMRIKVGKWESRV